MRTFSEINRDIQHCEACLSVCKSNDEYKKYKNILRNLKEEKEIVWQNLFEGHRNMVI